MNPRRKPLIFGSVLRHSWLHTSSRVFNYCAPEISSYNNHHMLIFNRDCFNYRSNTSTGLKMLHFYLVIHSWVWYFLIFIRVCFALSIHCISASSHFSFAIYLVHHLCWNCPFFTPITTVSSNLWGCVLKSEPLRSQCVHRTC